MWLMKPVTVPAWVALLAVCSTVDPVIRSVELLLSLFN